MVDARGSRAALLSLLIGWLVIAGGCSTGFLYNQLDWFITWRLNSYFSLDEDQEQRLRDTVSRNLDWIRTEQMPKVAGLLRSIDADVAGETINGERLDARLEQSIALFDDTLRQVVPDAAVFLADLRPEQVETLIGNLEDENEDLRDEYSGDTREQRLKRREKAIIRNVQRFTGRLSSEQRALVRYHVSLMHDNSEQWLESRRRWQQEFRALLLESPPPPEYADRLLAMSLDPNATDSPEYRRQVEENRQILMELLASLLTSLDDSQAARFSRRINRLADDLDALAAQPAAG